MSSRNPFASVIVDRGTAVAEQIAALLQGRVRIDPHTNEVFISAEGANGRKRVLLGLAGWRALAIMPRDESVNAPAPNESLTPRELEVITGMPGGTVRRLLMELLGDRLLQKDGDSYQLSIAALDRIAKIFGDSPES